jgi:acetyl-CoA/propionyl-CoA carboxylase biotin carboxyl carrier protein
VTHSTKWVEEEVDASTFAEHARQGGGTLTVPPANAAASGPLVEQTVPVEVDGRRYSVKVWLPEAPVARAGAAGGARPRPKPAISGGTGGGGSGSGTVTAPMQGTIVKVLVEVGATVAPGDALVVLEAMKMENHINAETSGTVQEIRVSAGDSVGTGDVLAVIA